MYMLNRVLIIITQHNDADLGGGGGNCNREEAYNYHDDFDEQASNNKQQQKNECRGPLSQYSEWGMRGWSVLGSVPLMGSGRCRYYSLRMARWLGSKLIMHYFPEYNAKRQT